MPLKLKETGTPTSTSSLNKWADDQEQSIGAIQSTTASLQQQITELKTQNTVTNKSTVATSSGGSSGGSFGGRTGGVQAPTGFTTGSLDCRLIYIGPHGSAFPITWSTGGFEVPFIDDIPHGLGRVPVGYLTIAYVNGIGQTTQFPVGLVDDPSFPWTSTTIPVRTDNGDVGATLLIF